jgi:hypothetical protein
MTAEWKEINLPWYVSDMNSLPQMPDCDFVDEKYPDKVWLAHKKRVRSWPGTSSFLLHDLADKVFTKDMRKRGITLQDIALLVKTYPGNFDVVVMERYRMGVEKYNKWWEKAYFESSEVVEWKIEHTKRLNEELAKSFKTCGLCKPGTEIEVKSSTGEVARYLIGDVNVFGVSDEHQSDIEGSDVVLRYRVLVER